MDVVGLLIEHGADPPAQRQDGMILLHWASFRHTIFVRFFA
jgi:ankyrin repeat protein